MDTDIVTSSQGWADFHTHCLPHMDDGASTINTGIAMLQLLKKQRVKTVALTPHFYAEKEDIDSFLNRRRQSYASLLSASGYFDTPSTLLGAEVHLMREISLLPLRSLCIEDTNLLLLELPFAPYNHWMADEIQNIVYAHKVVPVLAHIERYLPFYKADQYHDLMEMDTVILQVNISAFSHHRTLKFVKKLIKNHHQVVLGSDCHNLEDRKPNYDEVDRLEQNMAMRKYLEVIYQCTLDVYKPSY